jgi:hypothetical protein
MPRQTGLINWGDGDAEPTCFGRVLGRKRWKILGPSFESVVLLFTDRASLDVKPSSAYLRC